MAVDRTSCPRFAANQFRLLIHSAAFVLLSFMRRCLAGTELENAQVCTLQRKLLKLGVLIRETCRNVWLEFSSSCPVEHLWPLLLQRMRA
ncbi:MAG: transposase [Armatimonadota bacterium]